MNSPLQTGVPSVKPLKKKLRRVSIGVLIFILALELVLRFIVGLGNPPLYEKNTAYGYRLKPNQNIFRFFNRLTTNSFGMRSAEPNSEKRKILKIGDSITNGGMLINQPELASSILEQKMNEVNNEYQVLNVSTGGWNIANQLGFLKKYGSFSSELAIIEWNGTDLVGTLSPQTLNSDEFSITSPEEKPFFAIEELLKRYIIPQFTSDYYTASFGEFQEKPSELDINPSIPQMLAWLKSEGIAIIVYLHPKLVEVENERFDTRGEALRSYLQTQSIPVISGIPYMRASFYRDSVHLNAKGQKAMANAIFQYLSNDITQGGLPMP